MAKLGEGDELKLFANQRYTLWEMRDTHSETTSKSKNVNESDYDKGMKKVAWFDNLLQFQ